MKVKVLKDFKDLKENLIRRTGEEFEASKKRFDEIKAKLPSYVEEVKTNAKKSNK
ncbi:hypothetical protein [Streptococcus chenjunshii]|uniref:hypothetical protein n=1 Tax=Streptococcus chenjunshii TaxID=2173853 RepID=UPI0013C32869|nr:hypothetical protein [Streptococcus chenjunshii]